MGHVDEGDADLHLDALELHLELPPELEVQRSQRLVEKKDRRLAHQRPGQGDALLLAAGQLARAPAVVPGEPDELERRSDPPADVGVGRLAPAQPEGDVVEHREVREESVALEDHVHGSPLGRLQRDVLAAELDPAARRELEAADHPQGGRLAAAGRSEEREELADPDVERDRVDGDDLAKALGELDEPDVGRRSGRGGICRARGDGGGHGLHLPVGSDAGSTCQPALPLPGRHNLVIAAQRLPRGAHPLSARLE